MARSTVQAQVPSTDSCSCLEHDPTVAGSLRDRRSAERIAKLNTPEARQRGRESGNFAVARSRPTDAVTFPKWTCHQPGARGVGDRSGRHSHVTASRGRGMTPDSQTIVRLTCRRGAGSSRMRPTARFRCLRVIRRTLTEGSAECARGCRSAESPPPAASIPATRSTSRRYLRSLAASSAPGAMLDEPNRTRAIGVVATDSGVIRDRTGLDPPLTGGNRVGSSEARLNRKRRISCARCSNRIRGSAVEPFSRGRCPIQTPYRAVNQGVASHHWSFGNMPPVPGVSHRSVTKIAAYVRELQRANGIR